MNGKYDHEEIQQMRCWKAPPGSLVEVRFNGGIYRQGLIDDVMGDASGFWLAPDGVHSREYIERARGFELRLVQR